MKRRVFTQAFVASLVCGPAFAADPLPALQETPMFAEQVKSGALPPVAKRIPEQPWVVKKFAGPTSPVYWYATWPHRQWPRIMPVNGFRAPR